ncbi:MAG: M1 family metallopeptidase [Cyclobacteriaceae bacterium]|nr:M1 family metallopeptidase [Cyclobacteriaceae bacterium]
MKISIKLSLILLLILSNKVINAQSGYWQQKIDYKIEVDFDVKTNQYEGEQTIKYTNNSPDTLSKAFFHLYNNAFQPGSMMDVRNRTISDPHPYVRDRISKLTPEEIGFLHVSDFTQNGKKANITEEETILSVELAEPILPGATATFKMKFKGQTPLQIRRSGRDNAEGIRYSMSQWYPKLSEYDIMGWHSNPYIGREFYGVWGDFDVKITIDPTYVVGGSGYIQNPNEVGHGYQSAGIKVKKSKKPITWHFKAPNVHDFMWGADPDFKHVTAQVPGGPTLHFYYQPGSETKDWELLPDIMVKAFQFMSENFGKYPYDQFSVVQGGDGGMEYPMSTLITGNRRLGSLVGVTVHEAFHSWYQGILGTNESLYPWMDEGFTSYASNKTMHYLFNPDSHENPQRGSYRGYFMNIINATDEPMTIHSDHYLTNAGYSSNAYSKGAVFLHQLSYIIGEENLMTGMRRYFNEWQFKHPTPNDLIRIMEKVSGLELDWYREHFINSINTIDYSIESITEKEGKTYVEIKRAGNMPMPIELMVETISEEKVLHYIPLVIMRGEKPQENKEIIWKVEKDWAWTSPTYLLLIDLPLSEIKSVEIDPSDRMADVNKGNNKKLFNNEN